MIVKFELVKKEMRILCLTDSHNEKPGCFRGEAGLLSDPVRADVRPLGARYGTRTADVDSTDLPDWRSKLRSKPRERVLRKSAPSSFDTPMGLEATSKEALALKIKPKVNSFDPRKCVTRVRLK